MSTKPLYEDKSKAYKTSKDYARLKELLDAGHYIVCFIRFDASDTMTFFFTPYALSKMTAMVGTCIDTIKAKIAEDSNYIMTIQEPTVGAGGLIVAAMEFLRSNGINYSWNCFVDCGDIDARCFFMTYLTLSLLGVPAVVRLGDALKLEYRAAWFTPAYIFGFSYFYSRLKNGDYPRTATIPKTQSETKQVTEPPTTKADKYGQLSLLF